MGIGKPSLHLLVWGGAIAAFLIWAANNSDTGKKYLGPKQPKA